jgi:hypothetical protein
MTGPRVVPDPPCFRGWARQQRRSYVEQRRCWNRLVDALATKLGSVAVPACALRFGRDDHERLVDLGRTRVCLSCGRVYGPDAELV